MKELADPNVQLVPAQDEWMNNTELSRAWDSQWPRPVTYEHRHGVKCAKLYLKMRMPRRIVSYARTLYSLEADGLWRELSEDALGVEIHATDRFTFLDVNHVKKMCQAVHHLSAVTTRPFDWFSQKSNDPRPDDIMLFRNGRFDVRTMTLAPHDGRLFATAVPTYDYNPSATCPHWDRATAQWLDNDDRDTLHEFFGLAMTPDITTQKMLVMLGVPRSGKSTAISILELLCGREHSVSRTMDELCGSFGLQGVQSKRLMTIPDAHDADARHHNVALNRIKSITGRDSVSINRKNEPIVDGVLPLRLVMSANRHPKFIDESGALAAREVVLSFNRSFLNMEDQRLFEKLRGELSGIANRAIAGLKRLRDNANSFTWGTSARAISEQLRQDQSPAYAFAAQSLTVTRRGDDFISDRDLSLAYDSYCEANGIKGQSKRSLLALKRDLISALGAGIKRTMRRIRFRDSDVDRRLHGLSGISHARHVEFEDRVLAQAMRESKYSISEE